jgi:hypothetical protein
MSAGEIATYAVEFAEAVKEQMKSLTVRRRAIESIEKQIIHRLKHGIKSCGDRILSLLYILIANVSAALHV